MFDMSLKGDKALIKALDQLKSSTKKKFIRQSVNKSLTPMLKTAKKNCPKQHGLLKKSLGRITKTDKRSGNVWARIGARKGFAKVIDGKNVDPAKYAHLVELGTSKKAGNHFLSKAFEVEKNKTLKTVETELISKIENEAKKLAAKSK